MNPQQIPSQRPDFFPVEGSDIMGPPALPSDYAWMKPGHYAIYEGSLTQRGTQTVTANWAWEVVHNGRRMENGKLSCLGYTVFGEKDSETLGNWLSIAVLFHRFFNSKIDGSKSVVTPIGTIDCLTASRSVGDGYVNAKICYSKRTNALVQIEIFSDIDGRSLYLGVISDTNIDVGAVKK